MKLPHILVDSVLPFDGGLFLSIFVELFLLNPTISFDFPNNLLLILLILIVFPCILGP